jgi:hypothetical protein
MGPTNTRCQPDRGVVPDPPQALLLLCLVVVAVRSTEQMLTFAAALTTVRDDVRCGNCTRGLTSRSPRRTARLSLAHFMVGPRSSLNLSRCPKRICWPLAGQLLVNGTAAVPQ